MDDSPNRIRSTAGAVLALAACAALGLGAAGCKCDCGARVDMGDTAMPPQSDGGSDGGVVPGSDASDADAGDAGASGPFCGDSIVQDPEQCDDGNASEDDACHSDCTFACGDGVVGSNEECDVGLPPGSPGACPAVCDDGDACTTDAVLGSGCGAVCDFRPTTMFVGGTIIGSFIGGDGCCAMGANANLDSDCSPACGNGALEFGETCEPAAACPTSCDDGNSCTADGMVGSPGTCNSSCTATPISACVDGDGCCPAGCCGGAACGAMDSDCSTTCGDGVLDPLESCDPPSSCPTSCDDGDACTSDQATGSAANCSAGCAHTAVTALMAGDGCCPMGADSTGDADCPPLCGNGVVEAGESCDDGNTSSGDGCDGACAGEITAFRLTDLDVRDPHTFADVPLLGCTDVTDMVPFMLAPSVNESIQGSMENDWDLDGFIDVSVMLLFRPLDQGGPGGPMDAARGLCLPPAAGTTCSLDPFTPAQPTFYTNGAGVCLAPVPGTLTPFAGGYAPPITVPVGPCMATGAVSLTLDIQSAMIPLDDGQIAATYVGSPATGMVNGLIRGFISEATADATLLPMEIPFVGGMPLSLVLPGGGGNCAAHDDRDVGPDGLTLGWWVYGNFSAEVVTYTGS